MVITSETQAVHNTPLGPKIRTICKPCRVQVNVRYKQMSEEERLVECTHCKKPCKKTRWDTCCSDECRFLRRVNKTDTCWLWTGPGDVFGYGIISIKGKNNKAHRFSFELFKHKIEKGKCILHGCNNPKCVNPDHLRQGTLKENSEDRSKAGHVPQGSSHYKAKLDEEDIPMIKALFAKGITQTDIARLFNVSQVLIGLVVHNKIWKHVE